MNDCNNLLHIRMYKGRMTLWFDSLGFNNISLMDFFLYALASCNISRKSFQNKEKNTLYSFYEI
jgi:hypothetical protein